MAACRRVQRLLLLMLICGWIGSAHGGKLDTENAADNAERGKNAAGEGKAAAPDGASSVRRSGGWKLAEEAACREDVSRICPKHSWNNNLAVLECLQDRKDETEIASDCNHLLWNYKLNLTTDPKFESVAIEVCKTTISGIKECAAEERGKGYLVSCLVDHRTNISEYQCNQYITKMTSIVFSDYRLICGFMDKCKDDINKLHCGSVNTGEKVSPVQGRSFHSSEADRSGLQGQLLTG
ncbi:Golgi apparatus protein 1-like [Sinocyclocheilus rhinocerous]|uniref:Golgi apparatus protein 1-like n=1 Tax=Sinocyclocheilus rhinocerous TaxID=307959 RepID=UPI0007B91BF5|nr:PREDICTED: Golgi apparatus protein 1-like [Sinocyclocheilus rhinocerous]